MDWYSVSRALMFRLQGETSHELGLDMLGAGERLGLLKYLAPQVAGLGALVCTMRRNALSAPRARAALQEALRR